MTQFVHMKVESSMNRNSVMSVTIFDPTPAQAEKLVEGEDIVIPLFEGIVFSGAINRVNRIQLTPDNAPVHHYKWEIEATSDEYKLGNEVIPREEADIYKTKTPGELLQDYLGPDWVGDIATEGPPFEFMSLPVDKHSVVEDLVSQTGYDVRTRREYIRLVATGIAARSPADPDVIMFNHTLFETNELKGCYLLYVTGDGAHRSGGTILMNNTTSNGWTQIFVSLTNPGLPSPGDEIIILRHPVVDFKPVMGEGASVKTLHINRTLLNFGAIDDKSSRYTKVICTGRSYQGKAISSTLAAVYPEDWSGTSTIAYRGDGVLHQDARANETSIVVKGHQFLAEAGEKAYFIGPGYYDEIVIQYTERVTDHNGYQVTVVHLQSPSKVDGNYPAGTPVMFDGEGSKIYVADNSELTNPVFIGEECIIFTAKGSDNHGQFLLNCHRGQWQEYGYSRAYDHPIGTLVRNSPYSESSPHPTSPFAVHGSIVRVVNSSATCSRGDLDRLCSTLLPRGSNITNSGEGSVPLNHFWKIDEFGGYVPLQVGDTITVMRGSATLGDYVLLSYQIDFDRMMVKIRLGDYDEHIVFKLKDIYHTVTRQI